MEWISVKDRLPIDNKSVLMVVACFKCGMEYLGRTHICGRSNLMYKGYSGPIIIGQYCKRGDNYWWSPINPSYWMPLPQLPKNELNKD